MSEKRGKQWVDFRELKASISFEQVLERLDVLTRLTRVGDELQGPCPMCQGDKEKSRSFNVNVAKQIFQCFACKRRGNMLDFTAAIPSWRLYGTGRSRLYDEGVLEFLHPRLQLIEALLLHGQQEVFDPVQP